MDSAVSTTVTQHAKNIAVLNWLGTLFFGFVPGLIFYFTHKDDSYVEAHAKEALNWSITAFFGCLVGFTLIFILVGFLVLIAVGVLHVVYCVLGMVASFNGKSFRVPSSIRLVQ